MCRTLPDRTARPALLMAAVGVSLGACVAQPELPPGSVRDIELTATDRPVRAAPPTSGSTPVGLVADLVVHADDGAQPIDRRVFGTNLPAWLGALRLADPAFRQAATESGVTVVRMPGGSWSNGYDWRACEDGPVDACFFEGVARPRDFVAFLEATGLDGMWTVSINHTAQSAAAAVAFFNGEVDDTRPIGIDRRGVDWGTVAQWALLRASRGHTDPVGVQLWEVGNEVYGGRPDVGREECVDFGWEDVWTCDGTEYVMGDAEHDGYLAIRDAMIAVDPTIEVGAVGVSDPGSWGDWGNEVIEAAGSELDFYVVHEYGFGSSPDPGDALERPRQLWPAVVETVRAATGDAVPIAITEYNLVSFDAGDTERTMIMASNALYTADTLGQLVAAGVPIANHWNLANGVTGPGTDYGLINVDTGEPYPAFEAFRLWAETGGELLEADSRLPSDVHAYPTRHEDGSLAIVLLNLSDEDVDFDLVIVGLEGPTDASIGGWRAESLDDLELVTLEEVTSTVPDPGQPQPVSLPPLSATLLEIG